MGAYVCISKDRGGLFIPVGWISIIGALGGPCNGHLLVSQVGLVDGSDVGQTNLSSRLRQTCDVLPGG